MGGRLQGKTAIVIGAGSVGPGWSNGKAVATVFAREGANVYCVDINDAEMGPRLRSQVRALACQAR